MTTKILPFLTVKDAPRAIEFYEQAFGANELSRLDAPGGRIVAELEIDGAPVNVTDENPEGHNLSPETLGGTSVRIDLRLPPGSQKRREDTRSLRWASTARGTG